MAIVQARYHERRILVSRIIHEERKSIMVNKTGKWHWVMFEDWKVGADSKIIQGERPKTDLAGKVPSSWKAIGFWLSREVESFQKLLADGPKEELEEFKDNLDEMVNTGEACKWE